LGSGLALDVRLAARAIVNARSVSVPAIASLALAIGATISVFSVVNALLLRPLPVAAPDRLVTVTSQLAIDNGFRGGAGWSLGMWEALRERSAPFDGILAWAPARFAIGAAGDTEPVDGCFASGEFFAALGIRPRLGRLFTPDDDRAGAPVAVISHRLWQRRFAGSPDAVGAPLTIDGARVTVIGVTPRPFLGLEVGRPFDVAVPIGAETAIRGAGATLRSARNYTLLIMLRLKPGQARESATRVLRDLQADIVPAGAPSFVKEPFVAIGADPSGPASPRRVFRLPMLIMLGGVALVLLVACVNVANLLMARAIAQQPDLAVRVALGATRWRVGRPLLIESLLIASAGAAAGLVLAAWGARAIVSLSPAALDLSFDWRVAAFTIAVTLAAAAAFGVAPARRAAAAASAESLKRTAGDSPARGRLSDGLVAAQVALALVLVVSAALLVRTFAELASRPLGFDADRVLVVTVTMAPLRIGADGQWFARQLAEAARAVPGVEHAAASIWTPLSGAGAVHRVNRAGADGRAETVDVLVNFVGPGWFAAYGTPLAAGREFDEQDGPASPAVAIVNDAFVRRFLPEGRAVGTTYDGALIVGVAGDAVYRTARAVPGVTSLALREPVGPTLYAPLAQLTKWDRPPLRAIRVSVRAARGSPGALARSVGAALTALDPSLRLEFRPLSEDVDASLARERMSASIASVFGTFSLLLAALGIYGVTSYTVSRRAPEIGVRLALGATRGRLTRAIVARAVKPVALGVLLGLAGAAVAGRLVASLLFGVAPLDPATLVLVALALMLVAVAAALIPARRASRMDPWRSLRRE
jgi:predicted permease